MRTKTFYTDNEIVTDLYTFGEEWQLETGDEYKGLYHKYINTNEIYTGAAWNPSTSKKLLTYESLNTKKTNIYKKLKPDLKLKFKSPSEIYPEPTDTDKFNAFFIRYFIKKQNETRILEIDKQQYNQWLSGEIDPIMYTATQIMWYIAGNKTTIIDKSIKTYGVQEKNTAELIKADTLLPGILKKLKNNLVQYYTDIDYIVPNDINAKPIFNIGN